jgi:hypothetical protein
MRSLAATFVALAAVSGLSCKRPLGVGKDAGGGPPIFDAAPRDASGADLTADVGADAAGDIRPDVTPDITTDITTDIATAMCPAAVPPLDVCGCGCCGGIAESRVCFYPARGESRDAIPNPMPSPAACATNGCTEGTRHVCCADPGVQPSLATYCGSDTAVEDWPRFTVTRRDGGLCTTLEVGSAAMVLPVVGPPGRAYTNGWREPCDGSTPRVYAIGGLGQVTPATSGAQSRYDVHVALFFYDGTGSAEATRIDVNDVAIEPPCAGDVCPPCGGRCTFDAGYHFTTAGGLGAYRDAFALSPPASYVHTRSPEAVPYPEVSCAPAIPVCGGAAIDVADVMAAFADPDVRDALARSMGAGTLPFYGEDQRGGDGPAVQITRDGGGGFLVGAACPTSSTRPCMEIPPGMQRLVGVLRSFDQQQMADPSCAFPRL